MTLVPARSSCVPQPAEKTINVGDLIELDLELSAGQTILKYLLRYELSNEQAEFVFPAPASPPTYGVVFEWGSMFTGKVNTYDNVDVMSWVNLAADNFSGPASAPLDLMNGLIVRCLEETDVVLTVSTYGATQIDGTPVPVDTVMHTLTIHQIPEPATIALLGLGSLFLMRRRRK